VKHKDTPEQNVNDHISGVNANRPARGAPRARGRTTLAGASRAARIPAEAAPLLRKSTIWAPGTYSLAQAKFVRQLTRATAGRRHASIRDEDGCASANFD
jgi:hypothetical protein